MKKSDTAAPYDGLETLGDRIKHVRGKHSRDEFAPILGISRNTLQRYEVERRDPGVRFIINLCEKFDCDLHWLLFGKGQMTGSVPASGPMDDQLLLDAFETMETLVEDSKYTFTPKARAELAQKIYLNLSQDSGLDLIQLMRDLKATTNKLK